MADKPLRTYFGLISEEKLVIWHLKYGIMWAFCKHSYVSLAYMTIM